jgi:hypothetical protein
MKNLFTTISLLIFILLAACKKDKALMQPASPNATITPISSAPYYNGIFYFTQTQTMLNASPLTYSYSFTASASFFYVDSTHNQAVFVNSVTADSVALNLYGNTYSIPNYYYPGASCSWQVAGAGIIPSFTYTSPKLPVVLSTLPDTIDHTKPLSVFVRLSNGNISFVFIGNKVGGGSTQSDVFNNVTDTATLNFTQANTNMLAVGAGTIQIETHAYDYERVNGLPMSFNLKRTFVKPVYIK